MALRINTNGSLVIPPFECAWLPCEYELRSGVGCLSFEAKGETDVTIIFKASPGARRLQPLQRSGQPAPGGRGVVEENYTIILGSHRNRFLKFEKNNLTRCMVDNTVASQLSGKEFQRWWVDCNAGVITVGAGAPGGSVAYRWADPEPCIPSLHAVGLSCWDRHVTYRNIRMLPPVDFEALARQARQPQAIPTLLDITMASAMQHACAASICVVLDIATFLLPNTLLLYNHAVEYVARQLEQVLLQGFQAFCRLPAEALADVLAHNALALNEGRIFEAAAAWAMSPMPAGHHVGAPTSGAGATQPAGKSSLRPAADVERVMSLVKFPLMTPAQLAAVRCHAVTRAYACVAALLEEAQELTEGVMEPAPDADAAALSALVPSPGGCDAAVCGQGPLTPLVTVAAVASSSSGLAAPAVAAGPQQPGSPQKSPQVLYAVENRRLLRTPLGASSQAIARYQRRTLPLTQELMYVCDGDQNGALWFIATQVTAAARGPLCCCHPARRCCSIPHPLRMCARRHGSPPAAPQPARIARKADEGQPLKPLLPLLAPAAAQYGSSTWVNPVLAKRVEAKASSPASRVTDPKAIAGGTCPHTNFACPRYQVRAQGGHCQHAPCYCARTASCRR